MQKIPQKYQVENEKLYLCFNCEGTPGFYFEFEDQQGIENPSCPNCSSLENTLPKFYLEEMSIPALQEVLSEYAERTQFIPLLDLKFENFILPAALKCHHSIKGA